MITSDELYETLQPLTRARLLAASIACGAGDVFEKATQASQHMAAAWTARACGVTADAAAAASLAAFRAVEAAELLETLRAQVRDFKAVADRHVMGPHPDADVAAIVAADAEILQRFAQMARASEEAAELAVDHAFNQSRLAAVHALGSAEAAAFSRTVVAR